MKNNIIKFPVKPFTSEEIAAWNRFAEWASTATETDWTEKYGDNANELYAKLHAILTSFQERLNQSDE
jgi:hypothetical protein